MPHLDEGTLQAYLDGSRSGQDPDEREAVARHLAGCSRCAAALAALEDEGARATALLGTSAAAGPPPFEAIRRRAAAGAGAAKPRPRRRWAASGWAASVAVALGAGWLANDLLRRTPQAVIPAAETVDAAAEVAPASPPAVRAESPSRDAAAAPPEAEVQERRREVPSAAAPSAPAAVSAPDPGAAPAAGDLYATSTAEAITEVAAERTAPSASGVVRGRVTDDDGRPLEAAQVWLDGSDTGTLTRADGTFALQLPSRPADSFRDLTLRAALIGYRETTRAIPAVRLDTVAADIRLSASPVALSETVVTGVAEPEPDPAAARVAPPSFLGAAPPLPAPWTPLDAERLEATVGFAPLAVPDLEVVSREVRVRDGVAEARIVQRLDDGSHLTLLQSLGSPPTVAPEPDTEGLTVQVGEVWVVARAARSAEELQALVDRMR